MKKRKVSEKEIRKLLDRYYGFNDFKEPQLQIITDILSGNDVLAILGTGAGKSLCYQLPAIYMAEENKTTIVIEPVLSLMNNQCYELNHYLKKSGASFSAITINSQTSDEVLNDFRKNQAKYRIIYVSPEKFASVSFHDMVKTDVSMIVVDEAHCVSLWGHDFRISYSKIGSVIRKRFKPRPVISAFTATATPHVIGDIVSLLGLKIDTKNQEHIFKGGIIRDNLKLITYEKSFLQNDQPQFIKDYVSSKRDALGIIYCNTKSEVKQVCKDLSNMPLSIDCAAYYGVSDPADSGDNDNSKTIIQQNTKTMHRFYHDDQLSCVVATTAFGMGIDKSRGRDVTYVINYGLPRSIESFFQEIGRAGRHTEEVCDCILLYDPNDVGRLKSWLYSDPNYIITSSEYKLAVDRIEKMEEYAKLTSCEERNAFIEKYFESYSPDIDMSKATKSIYLNRSKLGWHLIEPENLSNDKMPDQFDVMVLDAINSHIINGASGFTYLDILRTLSGKDYFDSKSPLQDAVRESLERLKSITITDLPGDAGHEIQLLRNDSLIVSPGKRGQILFYNENRPSEYFDESVIHYKMPSEYLGLPTAEQRENKKLLPMPQTKEGLMIKYHLLSRITYARFLYMSDIRDEHNKRILINPSINISDMLHILGISFPDTSKGALAKKKRLFVYIRDYLEALKDYRFIEGYIFGKTKRCTKNTLFLCEQGGDNKTLEFNTVKIVYRNKI